MNILITGGTGFIGDRLRSMLLRKEHYLKIITRNPSLYEDAQSKNLSFISYGSNWEKPIEWADAIINLAGASIFGQRWTDNVKEKIYSSRINTTKKIVQAVQKVEQQPEVMISGSAVGYYGDRKIKMLNENEPAGNDFLANVCKEWEKAAAPVKDHGVRLVLTRTGIVLGKEGGILKQMLPAFKLFLGGPVGHGTQYLPWIHRYDFCRGLLFILNNKNISGPVNICAPNAVTMNEFAQSLGKVLNRPAFLRVPEWALNIALGEAAKPVVESIRAHPQKLKEANFNFEYHYLQEALAEIL